MPANAENSKVYTFNTDTVGDYVKIVSGRKDGYLSFANVEVYATDYKVKLIDFGFATNCSAGHKLKQFCGTPMYMDPDLIHKKEYYGQAADVWALGVVLFLLVTGELPFWSLNEKELKRHIGTAKYSFPTSSMKY